MRRLKVHRSVYSDMAIEKTRQAYKKIALTTISRKQEYTVITFWKCKYNEDLTLKEFENYMIGVENS